jgi:acyl transferase domain-containing protein
MGMLFPSSESQRDLMIETYKEANIDPSEITYFEAHATGTKVIDFNL